MRLFPRPKSQIRQGPSVVISFFQKPRFIFLSLKLSSETPNLCGKHRLSKLCIFFQILWLFQKILTLSWILINHHIFLTNFPKSYVIAHDCKNGWGSGPVQIGDGNPGPGWWWRYNDWKKRNVMISKNDDLLILP